jgi:hypothetical protein
MTSSTCANCGAPDAGDLVICKFCKQAVSAEALKSAIPCPNPQCRALCRWGKQHCPQCQSWIVVSCVFCGALSPHSMSSCLQCHQAFAGAPQRKAQMEAQRQHQQNMQSMNAFGNLASGFLGGMAGAAIGSSLSSSSDWSDDGTSNDSSSFSEGFTGDSAMSDGASFDWGCDESTAGDDGGDFGGGGSSDDY